MLETRKWKLATYVVDEGTTSFHPLPFTSCPSPFPPSCFLLCRHHLQTSYKCTSHDGLYWWRCWHDVVKSATVQLLSYASAWHQSQLLVYNVHVIAFIMWWHLQSFITWASIWSQMSAYVLKLHLQSRIALEFSGSRQSYCNDNQQLTFLGATLYVLCTKYVNTTFRTLYEVLRVKKF